MSILASLAQRGVVREGVMLSDLTTYKIGGPARLFASIRHPHDLAAVVELITDEHPEVLVLGRGSNLVLSDRGFDGLVIHLGGTYAEAEVTEEDAVESGGAMAMPALARFTVKRGLGGLEFLVGIPGSVGGGVRMNAGCHGSEIVDVLAWAEVVDLRSGDSTRKTPDELALTYRSSSIQDHQLVTRARFITVPGSRSAGEARLREISRWRREHQPGGTLNAGSVFKNPPGDAAGRIIDQLGLKGFRVGRVAVSPRHANFFEAERGASAQEVYDLVSEVRERVLKETGILLEPEIRFVGTFGGSG